MGPSLADAPRQIAVSMSAMPQNNVGALYAKLRPPFSPIAIWKKVEIWGQVCDGHPHKDAVLCSKRTKAVTDA